MSGSASSHPFTFFRGSTQIYPEQPKLRFASRDADTLELRVPSGTLAGGDDARAIDDHRALIAVFLGTLNPPFAARS